MHTGLAVITGTEDRQYAYVALTRRTHDNTAYVYTRTAKQADPVAGPRPAPELARYDRLARANSADPAVETADTEDALGVFAEVLSRNGQQLSASEVREQELSDADHLTDPVGPEPAAGDPDLRAAWHEALAVLAPVGGPDVRGMTDGRLLHLRGT